MGVLKEIYEKEITKRILVLVLLGLILYLLRGLINLLLLTFIFTYLIYSMQRFLTKWISKVIRVNDTLITITLYIILISLIGFFIYKYIPTIINQVTILYNDILKSEIYIDLNNTIKSIIPYTGNIDIGTYTKGGITFAIQYATAIGKGSVNIFLALMLSLVFMLGKKQVSNFMKSVENSTLSGIYKYLKYFGLNFINSFGKVIEAQILIATINSLLSLIVLWVMAFPQLLGLTVMIFVLSLIPVAGTFISLIPLSLIAYTIGGPVEIIYVVGLVALLHTLENYVFNPKFMSNKTELPVFIIFVILIVSEYFMSIWGFLLGVPLFMFFMDLLDVKLNNNRVKIKEDIIKKP